MINVDTLRERIRERLEEDDSDLGYCLNCNAQLTEADYEAEECTACHSSLMSDDEDLWEVADYTDMERNDYGC